MLWLCFYFIFSNYLLYLVGHSSDCVVLGISLSPLLLDGGVLAVARFFFFFFFPFSLCLSCSQRMRCVSKRLLGGFLCRRTVALEGLCGMVGY